MSVIESAPSNSLLAALMNEEIYQPGPPLSLVDAGLSEEELRVVRNAWDGAASPLKVV